MKSTRYSQTSDCLQTNHPRQHCCPGLTTLFKHIRILISVNISTVKESERELRYTTLSIDTRSVLSLTAISRQLFTSIRHDNRFRDLVEISKWLRRKRDEIRCGNAVCDTGQLMRLSARTKVYILANSTDDMWILIFDTLCRLRKQLRHRC